MAYFAIHSHGFRLIAERGPQRLRSAAAVVSLFQRGCMATINGGAGADTLTGTSGDDTITGFAGRGAAEPWVRLAPEVMRS